MPSALRSARQAAADAQARLASAHDRIRELEEIASALNRRLIEANERVAMAETQLASANTSADVRCSLASAIVPRSAFYAARGTIGASPFVCVSARIANS